MGLALFFEFCDKSKDEDKNNSTSTKDEQIQTDGSECGNNLFEPDAGENKENCPQDCSAGD